MDNITSRSSSSHCKYNITGSLLFANVSWVYYTWHFLCMGHSYKFLGYNTEHGNEDANPVDSL